MTSLHLRDNNSGKIEEPNIIFRSIQSSLSVEKLMQSFGHTRIVLGEVHNFGIHKQLISLKVWRTTNESEIDTMWEDG